MSASGSLDAASVVGRPVIGGDGAPLGTVEALLVDPVDRSGRWLGVRLASAQVRLVPVVAASVDGRGQVHLPWTEQFIAGTPPAPADAVDDELAAELSQYYAVDRPAKDE